MQQPPRLFLPGFSHHSRMIHCLVRASEPPTLASLPGLHDPLGIALSVTLNWLNEPKLGASAA